MKKVRNIFTMFTAWFCCFKVIVLLKNFMSGSLGAFANKVA